MKKTTILKMLALVAGMTLISFCGKKPDGIYAIVKTNRGDMSFKLFYDKTPITVANFMTLAEGTNPFVADSLKNKPYYQNVTFHRIIKDFMIQGGDRMGTGMGTPGYAFKDEIVDSLMFDKKGLLAMANAGPRTNGSQFFITLANTEHLNGRHTIFGEIVEGQAVLDSIGNTLTSKEPQTQDKPIDKVIIENVTIQKNGKEARQFDEVKVFTDYMNTVAQVKKEAASQLAEQKKQADSLPSGVRIFTITKGNGTKPQEGEQVSIDYEGYLADGTLFDTSRLETAKKFDIVNEARAQANAYRPMTLSFSKEMSFIPGFKEGLLSLEFGQEALVFIPSALGYGASGAGGVIPPNADLIFYIKMTKDEAQTPTPAPTN